MKILTRRFILAAGLPVALLALGTAACNKVNTSSGKGQQAGALAGAQAETPDTVVATVQGQNVTLGELDEHIKAQLSDLDEQKFQMRKQGLESMLNERLVKAEAKTRGVTEEEYFKSEVEAKVPPPPDADIQKFFEENKARLPPDAKLADFRDRIVAFMNRQAYEKRAKEVFDELHKKANVTITLKEPAKPRIEVAAEGPARGPENAKITIVEFSDFECPFCSRAKTTVDEVLAAYPNDVRLVFRQFPLGFHKRAQKAAEAALCASEQNKFWEYHDALFGAQDKLEVADLKAAAATLGLDATAFNTCLDSGKKAEVVTKDMEAGKKAGVSGTPAFFINGVFLSGAQPVDEFKKVIAQELATK